MRLVLPALGLLFSFCAVLGSRARIYDAPGLKTVKSVGLVTRRADQPKNTFHKIIKAAFTKELLDGLAKKNLFKVVVLDTMENEKLELSQFSTEASVDAILLVDWKLARPEYMVTDARVTIRLLKKENKDTLLIALHDTRLGNSYWITPFLPATLLDATTGALNALEKKMRSMP